MTNATAPAKGGKGLLIGMVVAAVVTLVGIALWIVQLSGGRGVYLPTQRGNANIVYSASMFCNPIGYQGGQELVEYTLGVLNEMKEKDGK